MDLLGIAQQGLQQAQGQFEQSVQGVVQASSGSQAPIDSVSLSDAAVSMLSARNQFEAAIKVAHVADEMDKATLDLLG